MAVIVFVDNTRPCGQALDMSSWRGRTNFQSHRAAVSRQIAPPAGNTGKYSQNVDGAFIFRFFWNFGHFWAIVRVRFMTLQVLNWILKIHSQICLISLQLHAVINTICEHSRNFIKSLPYCLIKMVSFEGIIPIIMLLYCCYGPVSAHIPLLAGS